VAKQKVAVELRPSAIAHWSLLRGWWLQVEDALVDLGSTGQGNDVQEMRKIKIKGMVEEGKVGGSFLTEIVEVHRW
jgi:hypothetical protein